MGASISIRFLTKRRNQTSQANHLISSRSSRKKSSNFLFSFFLNSVAPLVPSCSASGFTGPSGFFFSSPSCFWIFPLKPGERKKEEKTRSAGRRLRKSATSKRKTERQKEEEREREREEERRREKRIIQTTRTPFRFPFRFLFYQSVSDFLSLPSPSH